MHRAIGRESRVPRRAPSLKEGGGAENPRPAVLVLGVYLAGRPHSARSIVSNVAKSRRYDVVQRWIALGGMAHDAVLTQVTCAQYPTLRPKFPLLNDLLSRVDYRGFAHLVIFDDDIFLPDGFLDRFLDAQQRLGYALAQPARTANSHIDHAIVEQEPGTFARETRWVEVGPVVSMHQSAFESLLPFDVRSPMGWGYENVWAYELARRGLTMGIIDAVAVEHTLRPPQAHYDGKEAHAARARMLAARRHLPDETCKQILARIPLDAHIPPPSDVDVVVEMQDLPLPQFAAFLAEEAAAANRPCRVLDWSGEMDVCRALDEQIVFAPCEMAGSALPYIGKTAEVVIAPSTETAVMREARRVARLAVAVPSRNGHLRVEWLRPHARASWPSVSIVIPTFDRGALLDECLAAVLCTLPPAMDVEVVVVDDGSCDDTQIRLAAWASGDRRVRQLRTPPPNRGFVDACNRGAHAARGDLLVLLNNDTVPRSGWLEALVQTFADRPDAGAVGGKLVYPDGRLQEAGGLVFADGSAANVGRGDTNIDAPVYNFVREVDYCSGALLATPRLLFVALGGLDRRYAPAYYEDTDYCFRVRETGRRVYYQPKSVVVHIEGATAGVDPAAGTKRFQEIHRQTFRDRWRHVLPDQPQPGSSERSLVNALAARARPADDSGRPRTALVCAPTLPEYDRESGSRRIFDHIRTLRAAGWSVVFAAENGYTDSRYARALQQTGIETYCGFAALDELLRTRRIDLSILAFWSVAEGLLPCLRILTPRTPVLVDSIDLHFLRNGRRIRPDWSPEAAPAGEEHSRQMEQELAVYRQADGVLTVSQNEAELVTRLAPGARVFVAPDGEDLTASGAPWPARRGLLFVGNFRHPPNREAIAYLCRHIVPLLPRDLLARHPLYLVGTDLDEEIRSLGMGVPNVLFVGWVPDLEPYYANARVFLAPLRHGAGTKRKLVQALMCGVPSVVTSVAAEGLPVRHHKHLLIADDAQCFASAIVRLAEDESLSADLSARARETIAAHHSRRTANDALLTAVHAVLGRQ
ncbi:MAG TPA: glycosyltransferase [Thermoanaerobaculia bacterium]|nr:glycosyltransferase [Thermoanaerobaculia bacterium]